MRFDEWGGELQIRVEADAAVWTDVGAETATGTGIGDDTVQQAGGADDGIKRTLLEAAAAAVTGAVIDGSYQRATGFYRDGKFREEPASRLGGDGGRQEASKESFRKKPARLLDRERTKVLQNEHLLARKLLAGCSDL